jgi:small-conductance mechanosensitive channel
MYLAVLGGSLFRHEFNKHTFERLRAEGFYLFSYKFYNFSKTFHTENARTVTLTAWKALFVYLRALAFETNNLLLNALLRLFIVIRNQNLTINFLLNFLNLFGHCSMAHHHS